MKCKKVKSRLTDYVDGILRPAKTERIRSHLAICPACAEEAEQARLVVTALLSIEDVSPPEDGLHRLETRLAFLPHLPEPRPVGRLRSLALPYVAGLATAAVLILALLPLFRDGETVAPPPAIDDAGAVVAPLAQDLLPGERPLRYVVDDAGNLLEMDPDAIRELRRRLQIERGATEGRDIRAVGFERDW